MRRRIIARKRRGTPVPESEEKRSARHSFLEKVLRRGMAKAVFVHQRHNAAAAIERAKQAHCDYLRANPCKDVVDWACDHFRSPFIERFRPSKFIADWLTP